MFLGHFVLGTFAIIPTGQKLCTSNFHYLTKIMENSDAPDSEDQRTQKIFIYKEYSRKI